MALELAMAAALVAAKAIGACVLAFLAISLLPWLRDVWRTRHLPPFLPAPPFIGDLPTLAVHGMHKVFEDRANKYKGYPAFRVFVGPRVWVITADPESARRLTTRLLNRARFVQIAEDESALGGGRDLATLRGERWRRMRLAWLPSFAPTSLAHYAPLMDGCAKRLADRLEPYGESGDAVDAWRMIGALTLDVVGTTAFGTRFGALDDDERADAAAASAPNDADADALDGKRLVAAARTIFARGSLTTGSAYQALSIIFPLAVPLWQFLGHHMPDANLRELNAARRVISDAAIALLRRQRARDQEEEQKNKNNSKSKQPTKDDDDDAAAANGHDQGLQDGSRPKPVSSGILPGSFLAQLMRPAPAPRGGEAPPPLEDIDAVAQASLFVLAGYETTANTVACCVYALSTSPAAQRRLCAEVDAFFAERGRDAELTPDAVAASFPFAEGAVKEALRLYSPVTAIAREVAPLPDAPHEFRSDLLAHGMGGDAATTAAPPPLAPGSVIAAANYVYQRNADYWPRADEFLPERWVPEERGGAASVLGATTPSAWTPFGGGPRQCVGIKFAMLEAVIALARLVERFEFAPAPGQKIPLPMKQGLTLSPDGGVNVVVKRRAEYYGEAAAAVAA